MTSVRGTTTLHRPRRGTLARTWTWPPSVKRCTKTRGFILLYVLSDCGLQSTASTTVAPSIRAPALNPPRPQNRSTTQAGGADAAENAGVGGGELAGADADATATAGAGGDDEFGCGAAGWKSGGGARRRRSGTPPPSLPKPPLTRSHERSRTSRTALKSASGAALAGVAADATATAESNGGVADDEFGRGAAGWKSGGARRRRSGTSPPSLPKPPLTRSHERSRTSRTALKASRERSFDGVRETLWSLAARLKESEEPSSVDRAAAGWRASLSLAGRACVKQLGACAMTIDWSGGCAALSGGGVGIVLSAACSVSALVVVVSLLFRTTAEDGRVTFGAEAEGMARFSMPRARTCGARTVQSCDPPQLLRSEALVRGTRVWHCQRDDFITITTDREPTFDRH